MDMMTGLLNRVTGFATLEQQLLLAQRYMWPLTVCFVDIDNLKIVNDTYGHRAGDDLIISIGDILRNNFYFPFSKRENSVISVTGAWQL